MKTVILSIMIIERTKDEIIFSSQLTLKLMTFKTWQIGFEFNGIVQKIRLLKNKSMLWLKR